MEELLEYLFYLNLHLIKWNIFLLQSLLIRIYRTKFTYEKIIGNYLKGKIINI